MPDLQNGVEKQRSLSERIGSGLPFLRRHARALTGSRSVGDHYAAETLEAVLHDPESFLAGPVDGRGALFRVFYDIWRGADSPFPQKDDLGQGARGQAMRRLARLTPKSREALLLHTVEDFTQTEVATILRITPEEADRLVKVARQEMYELVKGRILVIEDETVIAMDIEGIVESMGHEVTGVATTADEAVDLGDAAEPDMILADIRLADGSSGIDAVSDLLQKFGDIPVVFITAFPELLLTGNKREPAFMIAKPYSPGQVMTAISQAMFFASTETLKM
ncbi:response regulator [Roseisalinus antarcticus]|uniref:Putative transcriptional regulatory protein pdtaR n=1 Tax=Roseisalinus antarcticus TaxID=254357 RepID=A0A1Y5U282_9RHOB|nr:response regulator [Roseisalinus antarcticus]SLN76880.1 putative transcriptional regulatory protein pdtaR [Roseisalinus antarcticus]